MLKIVDRIITEVGEASALVIPKEAHDFDERCFEDFQLHDHIESIAVEDENERFAAIDNCLFSKGTCSDDWLILGCKNSQIPKYTKFIGRLAFHGVDIKSLALPSNIIGIDRAAFACSSLESISFNDNLQIIGKLAFLATNLTAVNIPSRVDSIDVGAFAGCKRLKSITVDPSNKYYRSENNCLIQKSANVLVACAQNAVIPDGTKRIDTLAFYGMDKDNIIYIPASVTKINKSRLEMPAAIEFPITVKAPKDSYAINFAKTNKIRFIEV